MQIMKRFNITLIIAMFILCYSQSVYAQDGLILPMPGQTTKPTTQPNQNRNQTVTQPTNTTNNNTSYSNKRNPNTKNNDKSGVIIPLPQLNNNSQSGTVTPKPKQDNPVVIIQPPKPPKNVDINKEPLIAIPPMNNPQKTTKTTSPQPPVKIPEEISANNTSFSSEANDAFLSDFSNDIDDFPSPDSQVTTSPEGSNVENILPPAEADTSVAQSSSGENITIYPKDSGSAIFMVMKSWKCDDYDASSLINQALEVYGKDAAEPYQINGLDNIAKGVNVSVEEEDITLDELLDIIGSKTGNDWGCDITNKTIYIYPKGIKTESYVSWE